jgi:hypothetical protein
VDGACAEFGVQTLFFKRFNNYYLTLRLWMNIPRSFFIFAIDDGWNREEYRLEASHAPNLMPFATVIFVDSLNLNPPT